MPWCRSIRVPCPQQPWSCILSLICPSSGFIRKEGLEAWSQSRRILWLA
jgi:hypothetical protein